MHEYSYVKIPQTVWAEICVLFRVSILASLVLVLLLNTSAQFILLRIICLVSISGDPDVIRNTRTLIHAQSACSHGDTQGGYSAAPSQVHAHACTGGSHVEATRAAPPQLK